MDGLLESFNNILRTQASDVTVKLIVICPTSSASRTGLGDTEPKHAVGPEAKIHAETKNGGEIHVEALNGVLDSTAAVQLTVIPNRLATMFDGAGDLPQQGGLELWYFERVHLSARKNA